MTNDTAIVYADIIVFSYTDGVTKTFTVACKFNSQDVIPKIIHETEYLIGMLRNYGGRHTDTLVGIQTRIAEIHTLNRLLTQFTGDIPADRALTYTLRVDALEAEKQAERAIAARRARSK